MQRKLLNNRYELLEPLGHGGMATVYRGTDTRLGRSVAIKLLHAHYATDDEFQRRFEHEAQSAAGLSAHPNIVDVYDVGQHDGVPYIVMELVEGSDLKTIIEQQGPLPIERVLSIAQQAAEGLDYAHGRGLIHRDVKPQNIMVSQDGTVRITDFGIAKSHLSTAITQAGMTYGTADYISPEQAQGLPASPQSDIYSLGVVVYEMLTRRLPFTGDSPMAVAVQHIQQPAPPLRQWNPGLPITLERIVMSALAKDPRQRPASARAFAAGLRDYRAARSNETMAVPVAPRGAAPRVEHVMPRQATAPIPTQYRAEPRPRRPAPAYVPPPLVAPEPRGGSGLGGLFLGLFLLLGLLGIAYVAFATDTLAGFLTPAPTANIEPTVAAAPTIAPTNAPTAVLVRVPDLVGEPEVEVVQTLEEMRLRRGVLGEPRNDPAPRGTVIEQDPPAGTEIQEGSEVRIMVSLGPLPPTQAPPTPTVPEPTERPTPATVSLPNLVGQPFEAARVALEAAGFVVERQDEASQTASPGTIIGQSPPPGEIERGSTVALVVSLGDVVVFPDVIGLDRAQAEQLIENTAGLNLVLVDEQGPDRLPDFDRFRPNQVVSAIANSRPVQNGELVPRGAEIVLGVRRP